MYSFRPWNKSFNCCVPLEKDAEQAPAESSKEMAEKIVYLEKKVESQDEEIVLLKAALSDALRRLQSLEVRKVNVGK